MGASGPGPKATCAACDEPFLLPAGNTATVVVAFGGTTQLVFICPACLDRGAEVAGAGTGAED